MNAAEYLVLARSATSEILHFRDEIQSPHIGSTIFVGTNGGFHFQRSTMPDRLVFTLILTTENVASEDALVRALLASTFEYISMDEGVVAVTWPGMPAGVRPGEHDSEAEAREALLEVILAEPSVNPNG